MEIKDRSLICLCPHIDDDGIGCYRLLRDNKIKEIIYIDSSDKKRYYEAEKLCKELNIPFSVLSIAELYKKLNIDEIYLVPSLQDHHPLHKQLNALTYGLKRGIYTIDMNTEWVKELSKEEQVEKRKFLNRYYPSQKTLWEADWKYFLFEGVIFEY